MNDDVISAYKAAAKSHGEGTKSGNSNKTNRAYEELHALLREISDSDSDKALQGLFEDEDLWVQLWAAVHTLEIDEKLACQKLQKIAEAAIPLVSMNARYTLQEWKSGGLKFRN